MKHILYRMKQIIRQKTLLFWAMVFPVILGSLFYFMFGSISELEQFSEVPVGIVNSQGIENKKTDVTEESFSMENVQMSAEDWKEEAKKQSAEGFLTMMNEVESDNGTKMFKVKEYADMAKAEQALQDGKIKGIVDMEDDYALTVKESDIYSSLIKTFIDQYQQNVSLITDVAMEHPEKLADMIASMSDTTGTTIQEISLKGTDKDPYTQYFYALISMTCLIATMVGLNNGNDIQADLTPVGARRNVAPMPKLVQVAYDFVASFILYCIIVAFVTGVCAFVFQRDFGNNAALVLLGGCIGSFTSLAIGTVIAIFTRGSVQKKEGLCVAVFMISSFLAGLQWADITYLIEERCPIVNRINPATLIVNGFKSLSVFGDVRQYAVNMLTLFAIGVICVIAGVLKLRRMKYESI